MNRGPTIRRAVVPKKRAQRIVTGVAGAGRADPCQVCQGSKGKPLRTWHVRRRSPHGGAGAPAPCTRSRFRCRRTFLRSVPAPNGRLRLALDAHATLAFAAGSILNTKSSRLVELEQRTPNLTVWSPDDRAPLSSWPAWHLQESFRGRRSGHLLWRQSVAASDGRCPRVCGR